MNAPRDPSIGIQGVSRRPGLLPQALTLCSAAPWVQMLLHIHQTHSSLAQNLSNLRPGLGHMPWALVAMCPGITAGICSGF